MREATPATRQRRLVSDTRQRARGSERIAAVVWYGVREMSRRDCAAMLRSGHAARVHAEVYATVCVGVHARA